MHVCLFPATPSAAKGQANGFFIGFTTYGRAVRSSDELVARPICTQSNRA